MPDVILFDAQVGRPDAAFSLLKTRPGSLLIGIDPGKDQVHLWSGQQLRQFSTQDFVEIVETRTVSSGSNLVEGEGGMLA